MSERIDTTSDVFDQRLAAALRAWPEPSAPGNLANRAIAAALAERRREMQLLEARLKATRRQHLLFTLAALLLLGGFIYLGVRHWPVTSTTSTASTSLDSSTSQSTTTQTDAWESTVLMVFGILGGTVILITAAKALTDGAPALQTVYVPRLG